MLPLALSLLWGRLRMAGAIAGVMLAVLLHVTVGLAVIGASYLAPRAAGPALAASRPGSLAGVVVAASLVVFAVAQPRLRPTSASQRAGEGVARQVLR